MNYNRIPDGTVYDWASLRTAWAHPNKTLVASQVTDQSRLVTEANSAVLRSIFAVHEDRRSRLRRRCRAFVETTRHSLSLYGIFGYMMLYVFFFF